MLSLGFNKAACLARLEMKSPYSKICWMVLMNGADLKKIIITFCSDKLRTTRKREQGRANIWHVYCLVITALFHFCEQSCLSTKGVLVHGEVCHAWTLTPYAPASMHQVTTQVRDRLHNPSQHLCGQIVS